MPVQKDELARKVQKSYQELSEAATKLNLETNRLNLSVNDLDTALRRLNLGITSWVHFAVVEDNGPCYSYEDVGYAKVGGRWCLAIRTLAGNEINDESQEESWPFGEAPRAMRVRAATKIPELIEQLHRDATSLADEVSRQCEAVDVLTSAITDLSAGTVLTTQVAITSEELRRSVIQTVKVAGRL